jgi:predicted phosphoribosyltransferase
VVATPRGFQAVGEYYDEFRSVEDTEVRRVLRGS